MQFLCDTAVLQQLPAFRQLSARSLQAIADTLHTVTIGRDTPFILRVPPNTHYIIPLTTNLTLHRHHDNPFGMRLPHGVLWPITLAHNTVLSIRCHTQGLIGSLSSEHVNALMRIDADVRLAILKAAIASQQHITLELEQYMANTLTGRTAHLLLQLAADQRKPLLHYNHAQLATLLNVQRESVTLVLGRFRKAGWITTHYGRIELTDPAALERIANQF